MPTSQNGWPVVTRDSVTDRAVLGVEFPNGWLKGDVDVIFTYLINRLHHEVEPLDNGGCWGWFVKPIEGSTTISNHASGTAIDYNAPAHPMGVRNTYSEAKRAKIRKILADLDGAVRWGGDYTGRPDDMHFEIHATRSAVGRVADWIREQEDDMALTEAQTKAAAKEAIIEVLAEGYRAATGGAPDQGTEAERAANKRARNVRDFLRGIVGGPTEDDIVTAKAEVLAAVTNIVVARPDGSTISQAEVEAGVEAAFRKAFPG